MSDIIFTLLASVDGEEVYQEGFFDTVSLEESGLRKAEEAVAQVVDSPDVEQRYDDGEGVV